MPDDVQAVAPATQRDLATMPIEQALDAYAPNFAAVLPPNISVDHFKRMVVTAINVNPELMNADRRTLFNSCVKCASDGLLPDGREAALVIYKTKIKTRDGGERWIEAVQYMPMVAGIRKRLRNSGEVDSATAEVVYRKDRFKYRLGDGAFIEHEPPPLDEDRGDAIGAYAIIRLSSGEVIREVMGLKEIERARAVSRAKDAAAGPWVKWWSEMARKTVLRRAAKAAPQASTLEKLLMRDEDTELPAPEDLPAIPPRPRRENFALPPQEYAEPAIEADPSPTFAVVDLDGVETEYATPEAAEAALIAVLQAAAKRGVKVLRGAWESNDSQKVFSAEAQHRLATLFADLRDGLAAEKERKPSLPHSPAGHQQRKDSPDGLGGPAPAGDTETVAEVDPPSAAQGAGGVGASPAARSADPPAPDAAVQALIAKGDAAATGGTEGLNLWWQHGISPLQRGSLGARGRGTGPHYEAWAKKAAAVDAERQAHKPQQTQPAPESPAAVTITGQTGVEAEDLGYLHPAMAAQADKPTADLLSHMAANQEADSTERRFHIEPVVFQGKPDWRAWTIALFMPKLRQATGDTLPYLLGDNEAHLAAARAAGHAAEIDAAIKAAWAQVGAP